MNIALKNIIESVLLVIYTPHHTPSWESLLFYRFLDTIPDDSIVMAPETNKSDNFSQGRKDAGISNQNSIVCFQIPCHE